jgi:hypothetical protein
MIKKLIFYKKSSKKNFAQRNPGYGPTVYMIKCFLPAICINMGSIRPYIPSEKNSDHSVPRLLGKLALSSGNIRPKHRPTSVSRSKVATSNACVLGSEVISSLLSLQLWKDIVHIQI